MTESEVQKKLLEFNSDQQAKRVRKYYNQKSFMEILSKSRNENTHSFLSPGCWAMKRFVSRTNRP